jgi:hypothetical protein
LTEQVNFTVGAQFYNAFNHPNFGAPNGCAGIPGHLNTLVGCGAIHYSASPPTGLLGSYLGGDTAVRMIALRGTIKF